MRLNLDNLPSDLVLLHGLLRDMAAVVEHRDSEIERLQTIVKQLQRTQFGGRSERLDPDQPALGLEDLDRGKLPAHLPRIETVVGVPSTVCPFCARLHRTGEDVSERRDIVLAQFRVLVVRRPHACRA